MALFGPDACPKTDDFGTAIWYGVDCIGGTGMQKRAAIYVRVSTDKQTIDNQVAALRQIAERRGWEVVEQYSDAGISGAKGRDGRPGTPRTACPASGKAHGTG